MARDGGAPLASVARHRGRMVEIIADYDAANDSSDAVAAVAAISLSGDGDGGGDSSDNGDVAKREVA